MLVVPVALHGLFDLLIEFDEQFQVTGANALSLRPLTPGLVEIIDATEVEIDERRAQLLGFEWVGAQRPECLGTEFDG